MSITAIIGAVLQLLLIGFKAFFEGNKEKKEALKAAKKKGDEGVKDKNWDTVIDAINDANGV